MLAPMKPPIEHRHSVALPAIIHRGEGHTSVDCTVTEISKDMRALRCGIPNRFPRRFC